MMEAGRFSKLEKIFLQNLKKLQNHSGWNTPIGFKPAFNGNEPNVNPRPECIARPNTKNPLPERALKIEQRFVTRIGFKPMTCCLEGSCSIQLSYRVENCRFCPKVPEHPGRGARGFGRGSGLPEMAAKVKKIGQGSKPI
jgi:hypothetical protein